MRSSFMVASLNASIVALLIRTNSCAFGPKFDCDRTNFANRMRARQASPWNAQVLGLSSATSVGEERVRVGNKQDFAVDPAPFWDLLLQQFIAEPDSEREAAYGRLLAKAAETSAETSEKLHRWYWSHRRIAGASRADSRAKYQRFAAHLATVSIEPRPPFRIRASRSVRDFCARILRVGS